MYRLQSCPCCSATDFLAWPALVSPFVADFVLGSAVEPCKLLECRACRLRFFDVRYSDAELGKLYARYRGPDYFSVRHHHEPWYTAHYNAAVAGDATVVQHRRKRLEAYLAGHLRWSTIGDVLDYGGDDGSSLPENLGRVRYVYDLSDARPAAGVHKLEREEQLVAAGYDLVMLSHVLEHVADPRGLLRSVTRLARPESGAIFVEVPLERPRLDALGRGPRTERYLDYLSRHPLALRLVDFVSTAARVKLGALPPFGLMRAHEHINFFVEQALESLAREVGCRIEHMERTAFAPPSDRTEVLVALLRWGGVAEPVHPAPAVMDGARTDASTSDP